MLGYFKAVRKLEERNGRNTTTNNKKEMNGFNLFLESMEVLDIPIVGGNFTWDRTD